MAKRSCARALLAAHVDRFVRRPRGGVVALGHDGREAQVRQQQCARRKRPACNCERQLVADERRAAKAAASFDSFNNWSINLGLGTNNALTGGTYGFNPVTRIRTLLEWMYRGSWLARVGIDQVAMDMTRGGVNLLSDAKATDIKKLENKMARLRVWPAVNRVIKWSRLYGGCLGYIGFDGSFNQAITIRSFVSKNNTLYYQAGAGIVAKSDEESELQEVNNKLAALKRAVEVASQFTI